MRAVSSVVVSVATVAFLWLFAPTANAASVRTLLAPEGTLDSRVAVQREVAPDGTVRGVVTNVSSTPIEDVTIAVQHSWVWSKEWNHEGDVRPPDDLTYHEIPARIPPGGRVQFTAEPSRPLPFDRPQGGHYTTSIDVVSIVQHERQDARQPISPMSPTWRR